MGRLLSFICLVLVGLCLGKEHVGGRKSIIPRHKSEHGSLFHIVEPTEGIFKRSKLGKADESGTLHLLENFLLGNIKKLELSSKKTDIESQKEVATIAEDTVGKDVPVVSSEASDNKEAPNKDLGASITKEDLLKKITSKSSAASEKKAHINVKAGSNEKAGSKSKEDISKDTAKEHVTVTGAKKSIIKDIKNKKGKNKVEVNAIKRDQTAKKEPEDDGEYGSSPGNPAMSCSDLFTKFPKLPSGSYWIQTADHKEKMLLFCEKNVEYVKPNLDSGKEWKPKKEGQAMLSSSGPPPGIEADPGQQGPKVIVHPVVGDHLTMGNNTGLAAGPEDPDQLKDGMWPYESVTKILPDEAVKNSSDLKLPPLPAPQPLIPAKEPNQALFSPTAPLKDGSNGTINSTKEANNGTQGKNGGTNSTAAPVKENTSKTTNASEIGTGKNESKKSAKEEEKNSNSNNTVEASKTAKDGKDEKNATKSGEDVNAKTGVAVKQGDAATSNASKEAQNRNTTETSGNSGAQNKPAKKVEDTDNAKIENKDAGKEITKDTPKVEKAKQEPSAGEGKLGAAEVAKSKNDAATTSKETASAEKVKSENAENLKEKKPAETSNVQPIAASLNAEKEPASGKLVNPGAIAQKPGDNAGLKNVKEPESKKPEAEKIKLVENTKLDQAVNDKPVPAKTAAAGNDAPSKEIAQSKPVPITKQAPAQSNSDSLEDLFADTGDNNEQTAAVNKPVTSSSAPGNNLPNKASAPSMPSDGYLEQPELGLNNLAKPGSQAAQASKPALAPGNNIPNKAPAPLNPSVSIVEQPDLGLNKLPGPGNQAQVPEMTHDKMIELSSPPITSLGHTNVATEKDLSLPFDHPGLGSQMKPGNIVNQFMPNPQDINTVKPGPTLKPNSASVNPGLVVTRQPSKPTPPPAVTKGATTLLKPTLSQLKKPETLEEFEKERQKNNGASPTLEEGKNKPGLNNAEKDNTSWVDDSAFGLLGDIPWARDKAPGARDKAPGAPQKKSAEKDKEAKETKNEKKEDEKSDAKINEKKVEKIGKTGGEDKKNDTSKAKENAEKNNTKDATEGKDKKGSDKITSGSGAAEKNKTKVNEEKKDEGKKSEGKGEGKEDKNDAKLENAAKSMNATNGTTNSREGKGTGVTDKTKQNKNETVSNESKQKEVEKDQKNSTSNVLNSKASYQYIENKTTTLDNHEYHEALNKDNATKNEKEAKDKGYQQEESKQAQNIVPQTNQGAAIGPVGLQNTQNIQNSKANTTLLRPSNEQSTAFGNIHQVPASFSVNNALPLAALPLNAPSQSNPQFFVSSPVSNQSTTTTTSLLPVDPNTGDRVLNTTLTMVSLHGDEGTIPESQISGSDQVDWMKNNASVKDKTKAITKNVITSNKQKDSVDNKITKNGKKKSEINHKQTQQEVKDIKKGTNKKSMVKKLDADDHHQSEKAKEFFKIEEKAKKSETLQKLRKALEGTNVTIQNGVSTHMTFKSFVPRLSVDDVIDEQKRSSIPIHGKKEVGRKRSWEKKLGKVMGAVEGSNFSIENSVNSQLTFKSDIAPIKLNVHDKKEKEISSNAGKKEKANKTEARNKPSVMKDGKGVNAWSGKKTQRKKPEKVPYKSRKSIASGVGQKIIRKEKSSKSKQNSKKLQRKTRENKAKDNKASSRSGITNSMFKNKKGEKTTSVKGNHSEASLVSSFTDSKNAKESKSVTLTNVNKEGVQQGTDQNGTLSVSAKEKSENIEKISNSSKQNTKATDKNFTASNASAANTTGDIAGENSTAVRNETSKKHDDRGVFEPDIGTMKKMPETTDIKHHISTSDDKTNHKVKHEPENLLKGNVAEHKIDSDNILHAVYNVKKIDDQKLSGEKITVQNVGQYHIDEQNTLHAAYNVKPQASNQSIENSTSEALVKNLVGHHINNNSVLSAVYNMKKIDSKENESGVSKTVGQNKSAGVNGITRGKILKTNNKMRSKKQENSALKTKPAAKQKVASSSKPTSKAGGKLPTSAKRWHPTGTTTTHYKQRNKRNKSKSKVFKDREKKGIHVTKKDEKQLTKADNIGKMKKNSKRTGKPVKVVIIGKGENAELKKLRRIGLVIPEENAKDPKKISDKKNSGGKQKNKKNGKASSQGSDSAVNEKDTVKNKKVKTAKNSVVASAQIKKMKGKQTKTAKPTSSVHKGTSKNYHPTSKKRVSKVTQKSLPLKKRVPLQKVHGPRKEAKDNNSNKGNNGKAKDTKKTKEEKNVEKEDEYENELKQKQKSKKVRTIFFPQVFMKRNKVSRPMKGFGKAKGRQLIPTQVGDIEPSKDTDPQNEPTFHDSGAKISNLGNGTNPGNALYAENIKGKEGARNVGDGNKANKTAGVDEDSSKNTLDVSNDSINNVLNLTVGFLNKTFHDQFGKGLKAKHYTEGLNDTAAGTNATQNSGTSEHNIANGTGNYATNAAGKNNTSSGAGAVEGPKSSNGTANVTTNGAIVSENAGNNTTGQNISNSPVQNTTSPNTVPTNGTVNSTVVPLNKESNVTEGFRSERIPGVSKAAAVSDMMSPIENYILNMINETGAKHFGNQSNTEGKRGSPKDTNSTEGNGIASLLSKIKSGQLNLKSNEVSINLTPKKAVKTFSNIANIKAGAGLLLNLAAKRSTLHKKVAAKAQVSSSKIKSKGSDNRKKVHVETKKVVEYKNKKNRKLPTAKARKAKPTLKGMTSAAPKVKGTKQQEVQKKEKSDIKKASNSKPKAAAKSGIRFATTHKVQKISTFSSGPKSVGFAKGTSSDNTTKGPKGKNIKSLNEKIPAAIAKPDKSNSSSAQTALTSQKKKKETKDSKKLEKVVKDKQKKAAAASVKPKKDASVLASKAATGSKNKNADLKGKGTGMNKRKLPGKDKHLKGQAKRQNTSDKNKSTSQQQSGFPLKINGTKNDWGPVSENWPNFSLG
ncbi:uncharacterized protein LOC135688891 isoform X1 [Rhopilema esculentum]|uniref:uncharacterized protein LOC135688891 isoform X1 n=1 Tax=Rhopilema esculentum TaxID=499914 RepID=UPI0031D815BE